MLQYCNEVKKTRALNVGEAIAYLLLQLRTDPGADDAAKLRKRVGAIVAVRLE